MRLRDKILKRTEKAISAGLYKTTSFTLLKQDYAAFNAACRQAKRKPSVVLREMVLLFTEESTHAIR